MSEQKRKGRYLLRVILVQAAVMAVFVGILFVIKQVNPNDYKSIAKEYLKVADAVDVEDKAESSWNSLKAVLLKDDDNEDGTGGEDEEVTDDEIPDNCSELKYVVSQSIVQPVDGKISCEYGLRIHPISGEKSFHTGMDIAADSGQNIYAAYSGKVCETGKSAAYGKYLYIEHGDGVKTFYAHCSKILVSEGDVVDGGDVIALVGSTGWSTGPHLHFGLMIDGVWYNPDYAMNDTEV